MLTAPSHRLSLAIEKATRMADQQPPVVREQVTEPEELVKGRAWRALAARSATWLQAPAAS
jgi:hypothetical protein